MLDQQEIARRLASARKPKPWLESRLDSLAAFEPSIRSVGHMVLGCDENGKRPPDYQPWLRHAQMPHMLKKLNSEELLRLAEALFPRLSRSRPRRMESAPTRSLPDRHRAQGVSRRAALTFCWKCGGAS